MTVLVISFRNEHFKLSTVHPSFSPEIGGFWCHVSCACLIIILIIFFTLIFFIAQGSCRNKAK